MIGRTILITALPKSSGRYVALKFFSDELAKDYQALERFRREA
jgi:hypothetical protein